MRKKPSSSNFEELACPTCDVYLEEIAALKEQCKKMTESLQKAQTDATKYELTLKQHGLLEASNQVSDQESICFEQLRRLKEVSSTRSLTETESKILDILHRNLRLARGEGADKDANKNTKKYTTEELLVLVQDDVK